MLDTQQIRKPVTRRLVTLAASSVLAASVSVAGAENAAPPVPTTLAQRGTASVTGVIEDQLGGLLPGVSVTIADAVSGTSFTVRSNKEGVYEFSAIPESTYTLVAALPGFRTETARLDMMDGVRLEQPIEMRIGTVAETIRVVAGSQPTSDVSGRTPQALPPRPAADGLPTSPPTQGSSTSGIGGNIKAPVKIRDVKPLYPPELLAAGISDTVIVVGKLDVDGSVQDLEVKHGRAEMASATLDAIRQWQFIPTYLNGVPVETAIMVTAAFSAD